MSANKQKKNTVNLTRRTFLKGTSYASILSLAGISTQAFNRVFETKTCVAKTEHSSCGLRIIQETHPSKVRVTLVNDSHTLQLLNAKQPITVTQQHGKLYVDISNNSEDAINGKIIIVEGERISFDLANVTNNTLNMLSEHATFNRSVPIQLA